MKVLSRRVLDELAELQARMRELASDRNTALRIFQSSRNVAIASAQHEYWLEFTWLDQEYRFAVHQLAEFCSRHNALLALDQRRRA